MPDIAIDPDVLASAHPYDLPPPGFSPFAATAEELQFYGLPPRPSAAADPDLFLFWGKLLGAPLEIVRPELPAPRPSLPMVLDGGLPGTPPIGTRGRSQRQSSPNWSGAVITPEPDRFFMQVVGSWRVPAPAVPAVRPLGADPADAVYEASTWIGLGGYRPYNSLPQIGTSQRLEVVGGATVVRLGAWWQWWVSGRPAHHDPVRIENMPVEAGDEILAMVTVEAPGDAHFLIKNQRTGTLVTFKVIAPAEIMPLGATAEWIHERSTRPRSDELHFLPHCTDVVFEHCHARSVETLGASEKGHRLDGAKLVRMTTPFGEPHRSVCVSTPERIAQGCLKVTYTG